MWEAAKVFLAKHGQARSSPASLQEWTCGLQRNGMRFAPRIDMVNKHEIESIDNGYIYIYIWIYHVQTPFDQTSQIYINLPRWLFTPNKNAKTNTKTRELRPQKRGGPFLTHLAASSNLSDR